MVLSGSLKKLFSLKYSGILKMKYKTIFLIALGMLLITAFAYGTENSNPAVPQAFFPAGRYVFDAVFEGTEVVHAFTIQNLGSAPLHIKRVSTA